MNAQPVRADDHALKLVDMDEEAESDAGFEDGFGVICGEDVDLALQGDEVAVRAWAIHVLASALNRVIDYGVEAHELLDIAIEVLWVYSGGDRWGSSELPVRKWLHGEHPRGRQWSEFVQLVEEYVRSMNELYSSKAASHQAVPGTGDEPPF